MPWLEKRLRGAKVWMLTDEQGQPQSGPDNRVDILYKPGGKPYRASVKNLEDSPGAAPLSEAELSAMAPPPRWTANSTRGGKRHPAIRTAR